MLSHQVDDGLRQSSGLCGFNVKDELHQVLARVWMDGFGLGEGLYLLLGLLDHQVTVKEDLRVMQAQVGDYLRSERDGRNKITIHYIQVQVVGTGS